MCIWKYLYSWLFVYLWLSHVYTMVIKQQSNHMSERGTEILLCASTPFPFHQEFASSVFFLWVNAEEEFVSKPPSNTAVDCSGLRYA